MSHLTEKDKLEVIELTKQLIKIPSSKNDDNKIYEFASDYLKHNGFDVFSQNIENPFIPTNHLSNVYTKIGNGKGKKIVLNGHLDTVTTTESGWFYNPYEALEDNGKIYGLGASDMKAGCAALMVALSVLKRIKKDINGELFLSLVFGEEDSFSFGTDTLLREFDLKKYNAALVTEPSPLLAYNSYCMTHRKIHNVTFPAIITGAEGRALFEIEFIGKSAHASQPSKGINAIHDASAFINALVNMDFFSNIKMGRGEYCILNFKGATEGFTIPGYCTLDVNRHLVVGETWKTAMKEIKKVIKKLNPESKVIIKKKYAPSLEHEYNPYVCENNSIFDTFKECIPKETKHAHCELTTRSVGDFNFFGTRSKIPVIVFGPGGGNIHSPNEFVNKDEIIKTTEYILEFFMKIM